MKQTPDHNVLIVHILDRKLTILLEKQRKPRSY